MTFVETLKAGLDAWQIPYTEEQIEKLTAVNRMVMEANEHMNLTAIPDGEPSAKKHFLDSLNPPTLAKIRSCKAIIDVGSGAGFPGLPLAIMCPEVSVTLMDSRKKRVVFLAEVIETLGIANAKTLTGRAEDIGRDPAHREKYDVACARAVASLPTLLEYLTPLVKVGGQALCYKGSDIQKELKSSKAAVRVLGCGKLCLEKYTLFSEKQELNIVTAPKIRATSTQFPRLPGKPSKSPIQ